MTLVEFIKAHALKHYEDGGWDVIVECWDDEEIERVLDDFDAHTQAEALETFSYLVDAYSDRQADAINSAF